MSESILTSIKKILNVPESYTVFDEDIILYINGVFGTLAQLGIGPVNGFMIEDKDTEWDEYLSNDLNLNGVKTYIGLKVRMLFDPPGTSYHINAMEAQIKELEWRLNSHREEWAWQAPARL